MRYAVIADPTGLCPISLVSDFPTLRAAEDAAKELLTPNPDLHHDTEQTTLWEELGITEPDLVALGRGEAWVALSEAAEAAGYQVVSVSDQSDWAVYSVPAITYTYRTDGCPAVELDADNMADAVDAARDAVEDGSWDEAGEAVEVYVEAIDEDGDVVDSRTITVDIDPDHDALIRKAGGNPDCDHDWTTDGEGGCDENPGVWSTGGTGMTYSDHCSVCGLHRTEYRPGAQRNPGECNTFTYEQPEVWPPEAE